MPPPMMMIFLGGGGGGGRRRAVVCLRLFITLVAVEIVVGRPGVGHPALGEVDDPGGDVRLGQRHGQAGNDGRQAVEIPIHFPNVALQFLPACRRAA